MLTKTPTITNWFTTGSPYEAVAKTNALTFAKAKTKAESIGIEGTDDWAKNCNLKPQICLGLISKLEPGEGCLLLDADATVEGLLPWQELTGRNNDGAAFAYVLHTRPSGAREVLSGTLWITNTPECKNILSRWAEKVKEYPLDWDQRSLSKVLGDYFDPRGGRQVHELDWRWAWIEGITDRPRSGALVVHHQMSREVKTNENKEAPESPPPQEQSQKRGGKKAARAGSPVEPGTGGTQPGDSL